VRGALIVPRRDGGLDFSPDGLVTWDELGRVEHAGPANAAPAGAVLPRQVLGLGQEAVIVPGLVDLHVHLPQLALRGFQPAPLLDWLHQGVYRAESAFADPNHAAAGVAAFDRAIAACGTTTAAVYVTVHEPATRLALERLRVRGWVGKVLMDEEAPAALCEPAATGIAATERLIADFGARAAVTPRFAVGCSMELMTAAGRLADERGAPIMTHLAESEGEVAQVRRRFPTIGSYTMVYAAAHLLTRRTVLAHAIHLSEHDLRLVARSGAAIAHCPTSNLALGSGRMPLESLLLHRLRFGLGTDVGAGPSLSMWHVMAAYLTVHADSVRVSPPEALYRATIAGADILGWDATLAPGSPADLAVFRPPGGTGGGRSGSDLIRALAESTADDPEPEALLTVKGGEVLHARSGLLPSSA
jgi:guanine deaminase